MSRLFVNEITEGQTIDEVYLASQKQLRPNRAGNLYLQVRLSDKTGTLTGMMWNASQRHYDSFDNGDYVRVQGTSQIYNGGLQIIAKSIASMEGNNIDASDFVTLSTDQLDSYLGRLSDLLRSINEVPLRNLAECFLVDEEFLGRFKQAPAGIKNHHAYQGGLLEHVVSLMEICDAVARHYGRLNRDLLLMGAFLHDIGKTAELTYAPDLDYSDVGQLVGHIVLGTEILDAKIQQTQTLSGEPFPGELAMQLKHMILSHHGELEFGSPKVPMTIEAVALHHLDHLDAKMHSIAQIIDEDVNHDSPWTTYQAALGRKIYKGKP